MAISLKNCRVEQKPDSLLANWPDWALSSQHLLTVEADLFVHLFLGCTVPRHPLVVLRPPSTSFILSPRLTMSAASLSVLSKTQLQKAFSPNTHALSLRHSLPQCVYGIVRVPQNLDCTLLHSRSLLPRSKRISTQPQFSICLMRETVNEDNETQIGDTKSLSVI